MIDVLHHAAVFIGVLILGEFVLVPSLYLGWIGSLYLPAVIAIILLVDVISDTVSYLLGKYLTRRTLFALPVLRRKRATVDAFSAFFETHGLRLLYLGKFMVGARLPIQILCGMHHLPYRKYILVALAGSLSWTLLILSFIAVLDAQLGRIESVAGQVQVIIAMTVFVVIVAHLVFRIFLKRKLGITPKALREESKNASDTNGDASGTHLR